MIQRISGQQLFFMVFLFLLGTSTLIPPGLEAKQDAWIALILATMYGLILAAIYLSLLEPFQGKSFIEILPLVIGKIPGKVIGFLYILFFIHLASLVLRNISDFLIFLLPGTPISVITVTILLISIYALYSGLEVISRLMGWFAVIFVLLATMNVLALTSEMDFSNYFPVLENGFKPVLLGFMSASAFPYSEVLVFLMFIPYLNNYSFKEKTKFFFIGIICFTLMMGMLQMRNATVLGPVVDKFIYPSFVTINYASIAGIVESLAPFFVMAFQISVFTKLTLTFYASAIGLAHWAGLKDYKPTVLPLALIIGSLSIAQFENVSENVEFARRICPFTSFH